MKKLFTLPLAMALIVSLGLGFARADVDTTPQFGPDEQPQNQGTGSGYVQPPIYHPVYPVSSQTPPKPKAPKPYKGLYLASKGKVLEDTLTKQNVSKAAKTGLDHAVNGFTAPTYIPRIPLILVRDPHAFNNDPQMVGKTVGAAAFPIAGAVVGAVPGALVGGVTGALAGMAIASAVLPIATVVGGAAIVGLSVAAGLVVAGAGIAAMPVVFVGGAALTVAAAVAASWLVGAGGAALLGLAGGAALFFGAGAICAGVGALAGGVGAIAGVFCGPWGFLLGAAVGVAAGGFIGAWAGALGAAAAGTAVTLGATGAVGAIGVGGGIILASVGGILGLTVGSVGTAAALAASVPVGAVVGGTAGTLLGGTAGALLGGAVIGPTAHAIASGATATIVSLENSARQRDGYALIDANRYLLDYPSLPQNVKETVRDLKELPTLVNNLVNKESKKANKESKKANKANKEGTPVEKPTTIEIEKNFKELQKKIDNAFTPKKTPKKDAT